MLNKKINHKLSETQLLNSDIISNFSGSVIVYLIMPLMYDWGLMTPGLSMAIWCPV